MGQVPKYWTDKSYIEVSDPSIATHVYYGVRDHSAKTTATSNYFESKWGPDCLFYHHKDDSPYLTDDLHYYVRTPTITGAKVVCTSGTQFTVSSNVPSGYTWTCSSNLTAGAASGYSKTFSAANGSVSAAGWVAVNFGGATVKYDVWVGAPPALTDIYSENGTYCEAGTYTDWIVSNCSSSSNVYFSAYDNEEGVSGDIINTWCSGNYGYGSIYFSEPGNYYVSAWSSNACGNNSSNPIWYSHGNPNPYIFRVYSYSLSFNPKTNEIEIEFDSGQSAKSASANNQFTVTILDNNNTARSQNSYSGKNFAVPVSSLSDGTYDVKISDGNMTATKQLVIKR